MSDDITLMFSAGTGNIGDARIKIPDGKGGEISLPLGAILVVEGRIQEIATVNTQKAPELMTVLTLAHLNTNDMLRQVEMLCRLAEKSIAMRKSIVILEIVPGELKSRGMSNARSPGGSEDFREAILNQDQEYLTAVDNLSKLEAVKNLLRTKLHSFEMAFSAVKRIYGESRDWRIPQGQSTSAGGEQARNPEPVSARDRFGRGG